MQSAIDLALPVSAIKIHSRRTMEPTSEAYRDLVAKGPGTGPLFVRYTMAEEKWYVKGKIEACRGTGLPRGLC